MKIGTLDERGLYDKKLIIGYTDGRPLVTLRSGLDDLGNPLWSPDSRQFAFTRQTNQIGVPLEWRAYP